MITKSVSLTELALLKTNFHQAGNVSLNPRDDTIVFQKWKHACGRNFKIASNALKDRIKLADAMLPENDAELDSYNRDRAAIIERYADPKQARKRPEELEPGEMEQIRIDPTRDHEYQEAIKALDTQFDECLVRRDAMAKKLKEFQDEQFTVEFFEFQHGLNGIPLDMNGSYIAELEWMVTDQYAKDCKKRSDELNAELKVL